jgi:hypothetical protein
MHLTFLTVLDDVACVPKRAYISTNVYTPHEKIWVGK